MNQFSSRPIVDKIRLSILTTAIIAVTVSGTFVITSEYFLYRDNFVTNIASVADVVGFNVRAPIVFDDAEEAELTLRSLGAVPGIHQGAVIQASGRIFARFDRSRATDFVPALVDIIPALRSRSEPYVETLDEHLILVMPIEFDGGTIGYLAINASLEEIYARLKFQSMVLVLILFIAMLVAFLSGSRMQKVITKPIEQLSVAMREVTRSRKYSIRLEKRNEDEIGVLVDGFNNMLQQIDGRDRKLAEANDELEKEVRIRTRELEEANAELTSTLNEVEHAKDRAEAANRAKSAFLATMSHEIRTPINGLLGNTELLLNEPLGEQARGFGEVAYRSGEALLDIINDILDFSRIEAGRFELNERSFRLDQLVEDLCVSLGPVIRQKRLDLAVDVSRAPTSMVFADQGRVRQVLSNLITNAMKFTETGSITVTVSSTELAGSDLQDDCIRTRVEVLDTGIGIEEELQAVVFDRFEQVDSTSARAFGGTGLGLAICKELVTRMGGEIGVESRVNTGSRFWLEIPFKASLQDGSERLHTPQSARLLTADSDAHEAPCRSLVVDDSDINREMVFNMLQKIGCQTEVARDGREAIELAASHCYDLILMDCQMPEIDGFRATRRIRSLEAEENRRPAFIVALTANAIKGDRERCLQSGMSEYLAKPCRMAELQRMVCAARDVRGAREPGSLDRSALDGIRDLETEGSSALLERYVSIYLQSVPDLLHAIATGISECESEQLTFAAHSLKSESLPLGAVRLSSIACSLEGKGRRGSFEGTGELLQAAHCEFRQVERALSFELESSS